MALKKYIVRFLCVAFSALSASLAFAQTGVLSGTVTISSGQRVAGASVVLKPGNQATMTDEKGAYTLAGLPYGDYTLVVTSLEIQPVEAQVVIGRARQRKDVVAMESEVTQLDEANVSHNTEKREIETQGFAVAVVETKEASVRNIQTNELLDRTVGVRVRQSGGLGSEIDRKSTRLNSSH